MAYTYTQQLKFKGQLVQKVRTDKRTDKRYRLLYLPASNMDGNKDGLTTSQWVHFKTIRTLTTEGE